MIPIVKGFSTPEGQFILQCLRSELLPGTGVVPPMQDLNWDNLFALLEKNRLAPYFYTFSKEHPGLFPQVIREKLRQARYHNLLYGDSCKHEVQEVLAGLRRAAIPVIVLKGWALIQWLYQGDHAHRFCKDIDILVMRDQVAYAEAVLQQLGYKALKEVDPGFAQRFSNSQAYRKAKAVSSQWRQFEIGLHWGLTHYPFFDEKRVNLGELFGWSLPINVAGVDVAELSLEDQFIYTCAHLALHHRHEETLLNFFEIAAIISRAGALMDWQAVASRASAWGYVVQVRHVLTEIEKFWPEFVPQAALDKLSEVQTTRKELWVDQLVASTKGNRFRRAIVQIIALPGLKNKSIVAFRYAFPRREYMQHRYGVQGNNLIQAYRIRVSSAFVGIIHRSTR